jgi:hypothetical protein
MITARLIEKSYTVQTLTARVLETLGGVEQGEQ